MMYYIMKNQLKTVHKTILKVYMDLDINQIKILYVEMHNHRMQGPYFY